jgi:hypothetical protein
MMWPVPHLFEDNPIRFSRIECGETGVYPWYQREGSLDIWSPGVPRLLKKRAPNVVIKPGEIPTTHRQEVEDIHKGMPELLPSTAGGLGTRSEFPNHDGASGERWQGDHLFIPPAGKVALRPMGHAHGPDAIPFGFRHIPTGGLKGC